MSLALYISALKAGHDFFKEWKNLEITQDKQNADDVAVFEKDNDNVTFNFPNLSPMLNPSQWRNFDIEKAVGDIANVREKPENEQDLIEILQNSAVIDSIESLKVVGVAIQQLENNPEKHLQELKELNLIAPVESIKSYFEIISKASEDLKNAISDLLPDSSNNFQDIRELASTPYPSNFFEMSHKQNEELLNHFLVNGTSEEFKDLIEKTNSSELSAHPAILGSILSSRHGMQDPLILNKAEGGIALHISKTLSDKKIEPETKSAVLDSSMNVVKGLAVNSATASYASASPKFKKAIENSLDKIEALGTKKIASDFQSSIKDLSKQLSPSDLKGVLSDIAKTFQANKGAEIDYRSEGMKRLLDDTVFILKNPGKSLTAKASNAPITGPSPKR